MKKLLPAVFAFVVFAVLTGFHTKNHTFLLPTSLKVTVLDDLGNFVNGAAVRLYVTEDDYRDETNQVGETVYTDKKGKVTIKNLDPIVYYLYVTKDDMSNIGRGVMTDTLNEGKVNKINVIIE